MPNSPPRFLLGAALLFWGAMTERVVPGLVCALLVEGAALTRVRWNFGERASLMAWRLSVLFLLVAMVLVLVQGERLNAMAVVFTWLPVILLPLQFVQSYGMSRSMTLATFSMMVRRRREHAAKHGLPFREIRFSFGHVFFCATLLASCLGSQAVKPVFYPLFVVLASWALIAASGRAWKQVGLATIVAQLIAGGAGLGGQKGLTALYHYIITGGGSGGDPGNYARERRTFIGSMGRIKQSAEIQWRLIPEQGQLPRLLRMASYNTYFAPVWQGEMLPEGTNLETDGFLPVAEITNPENPTDPEDKFQIAPPGLAKPEVAVATALPRFRLRGETPSRDFNLLPLPASAASLHGFDPEEFDRNPFGTFRVKPSQPIADARVLWHPEFSTELPPWSAMGRRGFDQPPDPQNPDAPTREFRIVRLMPELEIPAAEQPTLTEVVDELGLREGSLEEKIARLGDHFTENFRYSRYNSVRADFDPKKHRTLIAKFLTGTRSGHCEFFATASALLLREAGVPTRYVSGFAVAEIDAKSGEALIRGTHAHAWCRAWDAKTRRWVDVDLTPPDWLGLEGPPRMSQFQGLTDWIQRKREDLLVWRDQPGHMALLTLGLLTPIVIGIAFIGRNLWRSRSRVEQAKTSRPGAAVRPQTPLTGLEKVARKILGERPPGMPFGRWLRQLAPSHVPPEPLERALGLHHRLRFDTAGHDPALVGQLERLVEDLQRELGRSR